MRYIDKSINEAQGKQVVDKLLQDSWDNIDACYKAADYESLCEAQYKSTFQTLLLEEQANLCCYCMKELVNNHTTTLEHIIPHKVKEANFNIYLVANELTNNVIYRANFDFQTRLIPPSKYPHDIAYHNLIASCNSNSHCNHKRGEKTIKPFIYDSAIGSKVKYDRAGNISCDEYEYENDLANVGLLRGKNPLKLIRMIWFRLSQQFVNLGDVTNQAIDNVIESLILLFDDTSILENFTAEPSYKDDVIKYKWFFDYYKNR